MLPIMALMAQILEVPGIKADLRILDICRGQIYLMVYDKARLLVAPLTQAAVCHSSLTDKQLPAFAPLYAVVKIFCKIFQTITSKQKHTQAIPLKFLCSLSFLFFLPSFDRVLKKMPNRSL